MKKLILFVISFCFIASLLAQENKTSLYNSADNQLAPIDNLLVPEVTHLMSAESQAQGQGDGQLLAPAENMSTAPYVRQLPAPLTRRGHQFNIEASCIFYIIYPLSFSVNGVWEYKWSDYFSFGAGAGISTGALFEVADSEPVGGNVFGRFGVYCPTTKRVEMFGAVDLGGYFMNLGRNSVEISFLSSFTIGMSIKQKRNKSRFLLGITANMMWTPGYFRLVRNYPLHGLMLGCTF